MNTISKTKGFTLIELLVVIAIISLLSSIVMASLSSAKQKAQITKIIQETQQFKRGMELYRLSNSAYYRRPDPDLYVRYGDSSFTAFSAALDPYMKTDKFGFVTAGGFHYVHGLDAAYGYTCNGERVKNDGYMILLYNPILTNEFKRLDSIPSYSCVLSD